MSDDRARLRLALSVLSALGVGLGCRSKESPPAHVDDAAKVATPDRLTGGERLPEAEIVFGLPIPKGMRLTRHFKESAYVTGDLDMLATLEHVRGYVDAPSVELTGELATFARASIKGDAERRRFRIEISKTQRGSQLYIKDITPPPSTAGLTEAERWQRAGRNPDGTLLNENQVY
jgi:hypothetical protein